jgi:hypothetical protein
MRLRNRFLLHQAQRAAAGSRSRHGTCPSRLSLSARPATALKAAPTSGGERKPKEGPRGTNSDMEKAGLADRPARSAQGSSEIQPPRRHALDGRGSAAPQIARARQHADRLISLKLQRPPAAIRSKAQRERISLRPVNRSPYSRRRTG